MFLQWIHVCMEWANTESQRSCKLCFRTCGQKSNTFSSPSFWQIHDGPFMVYGCSLCFFLYTDLWSWAQVWQGLQMLAVQDGKFTGRMSESDMVRSNPIPWHSYCWRGGQGHCIAPPFISFLSTSTESCKQFTLTALYDYLFMSSLLLLQRNRLVDDIS